MNRHTYTIELIAQHMENSGQTVLEMIEVLKNQGIVSLNEEVRSSIDKTQVAYENLLRMFKVFDLNDSDKHVLKILSLMPLSGVDVKDLRNWLGVSALKVLKNLENRSWITSSSNGIALHPIIRDVVRHELPLAEEEAKPFLDAFNETIKEEKSWHYPIGVKSYYADIASEILQRFGSIDEITLPLLKSVELLYSFSVKPGLAIELGKKLFEYFAKVEGEKSFLCAYYAFQIGWTYLFNLHLSNSIQNAKDWFERSYTLFDGLPLDGIDEYAAYGHLLTHLCRIDLLLYGKTLDSSLLSQAKRYAEMAVANAEAHLNKGTRHYSRLAVAYMQLSDYYSLTKEFGLALELIDKAYDIMFSLWGENDPDTLNVSSSKVMALCGLGRFKEALEIGSKNLDFYSNFYGEMNIFTFRQMVTVYKCYIELGDQEGIAKLRERVLKIGRALLAEHSDQLKEIEKLSAA